MLDCARYIAMATIILAEVDNELHTHRMAAIQRTEGELHELEAREADMLTEADALHLMAVRHDIVLQRQCALEVEIKAEDEAARCGKKRALVDV